MTLNLQFNCLHSINKTNEQSEVFDQIGAEELVDRNGGKSERDDDEGGSFDVDRVRTPDHHVQNIVGHVHKVRPRRSCVLFSGLFGINDFFIVLSI